jgi:hypothetical protein
MSTKKEKNKKELESKDEIDWIIKEYSKTWTLLKEYDEGKILTKEERKKIAKRK